MTKPKNPSDPELLARGRALVRTLRREGRQADAQTVDALLAAADAGAPWLTTGEVARRVGVSRQTVVNWVKKGLLPGVRLGGRTRIAPAALARFAQLEGLLDTLDTDRPPATPDEAVEAVRRTRQGWTWRQEG